VTFWVLNHSFKLIKF